MGAGFLVGKPEGKRPRGIKKWIRGMIILKVTFKKEVRWVGSFFYGSGLIQLAVLCERVNKHSLFLK
jgi:hypothetical protein